MYFWSVIDHSEDIFFNSSAKKTVNIPKEVLVIFLIRGILNTAFSPKVFCAKHKNFSQALN